MTGNPSVTSEIRNVLFVCTGNSCRSVMAEGLFNKMARERSLLVTSSSAGVAGSPEIGASPETVELLKAEGVDVRGHRSRPVSQELIKSSDLIVVMAKNHEEYLNRHFPKAKGKTVLLTRYYPGPEKYLSAIGVPDPIGRGSDFYDRVFGVIKDSVTRLIDQLGQPR